ncbi:MAG: peptidylprolyl isomerase [Janthinobacterium lividum]
MSLNSFRNGLGNITSSPIGKWVLFAVGAILVSSLVMSGLGNNLGNLNGNQPAAQSGETTIATVNGDAITRTDFDTDESALQSQLEQSGRTIGASEQPLLNSAVLDQLIGAKLQLEQAKKMGVTVSGDEITKERMRLVDQANYRQSLSLPATASLSDIDAALTKAQSPTVEDRLPDEVLRERILIGDPQSGQPGKLQTAFINSIVVSDDDARQFYTKYHTQHILIDNKTRSDAQAKAQAIQIIAKAKAPGADFGALAKQYSDDPGSKNKGGDDGFIDQTTPYVPEFKRAAFSLKPGEVTPDPVASTQYGYFIIKLVATKSNLPADFDKNKAKYIDQIRTQKAQEKYQALMTGLKDAAKIDVKDPALAGDQAFAQAGLSGNPALSQPKYQAAAGDYQQALKANLPPLQKATINAALGQVYQALRQTPRAIAAYEASLALRDDPALEMTTGQLELQNKQNAQAVTHFQKASQLAWNDQSTHIQLLSLFRQAGRIDLAAKEGDWLKQYAKAHPAPTSPGVPGMPGGMPVQPGAASVQPAGSVHVVVPPARKPGQ